MQAQTTQRSDKGSQDGVGGAAGLDVLLLLLVVDLDVVLVQLRERHHFQGRIRHDVEVLAEFLDETSLLEIAPLRQLPIKTVLKKNIFFKIINFFQINYALKNWG